MISYKIEFCSTLNKYAIKAALEGALEESEKKLADEDKESVTYRNLLDRMMVLSTILYNLDDND